MTSELNGTLVCNTQHLLIITQFEMITIKPRNGEEPYSEMTGLIVEHTACFKMQMGHTRL